MSDEDQLADTISDLSNTKGYVLSEEALLAKHHFDNVKDELDDDEDDDDETELNRRQSSELTLFNENIKILLSIFYRSQFDEYVYLLANPQRVYVSNFIIGIVRGMGFLLGVLLLAVLFLYLIKDSALIALIK